jgi:hypothetical protein
MCDLFMLFSIDKPWKKNASPSRHRHTKIHSNNRISRTWSNEFPQIQAQASLLQNAYLSRHVTLPADLHILPP